MKRKLSYRKAKKGVAEQYGISLTKDMLKVLDITKDSREIIILIDSENKSIIIKK